MFSFLFPPLSPPHFPLWTLQPIPGDRSKARLEVFGCSIRAAPVTTAVPPHPSSHGTALPTHHILASLALWLLLRPLRCHLVRSPLSLLCSAPHPEPLERGKVGLDDPSWPQLWPGAVPLQPRGFSCCCLSVFSHLVLLILSRQGVCLGLREDPAAAAQPWLGVLQAAGGSDPSRCSAQPGCARAAIPALP